MKLADNRAILGIDPSHRGLAFVFFEQGELVEWGSRREAGELAMLDKLLREYSPDVLVFEHADDRYCRRTRQVRDVLRSFAERGTSRGVEVLRVSRHEMRRGWRDRHMTTKEAVAAEVARHFPGVGVIVPPVRKIYRSEDGRVRIFDAAALVLWACGCEAAE